MQIGLLIAKSEVREQFLKHITINKACYLRYTPSKSWYMLKLNSRQDLAFETSALVSHKEFNKNLLGPNMLII